MRKKEEFLGMNKTSIVNQLKSLLDSILHGPPHYTMDRLVEENWFSWMIKNLRNLGNSHYAYSRYNSSNNGIFEIEKAAEEDVTIALLSDWASDTNESQKIAKFSSGSDYSIHLGDTYYVGNEKEIGYNFNTQNGGWAYGKFGSFAMLGNHEMYSSGKSYFKTLLPFMGLFDQLKPVSDRVKQKQEASFFCLENEHWRIIGLDTGYYSLKGFFGIKANTNLTLHDWQKEWLKNTLQLNADNRGLIFLSHHQCFSAFEQNEFKEPEKTIASLLKPERDILWLWGHEHWCSVYGSNQMTNGGKIFARCIGNSGMPVELNKKGSPRIPKELKFDDAKNNNLVLYDNRKREVLKNKYILGHNGYVTLTLNKDQLIISYYDDNFWKETSRKVLEEVWTTDFSTGKLKGKSITDFTVNETERMCYFNPDINQAIR